MSWIHAALFSAAILAAVNIVDSHLVSQRFSGFRTFLLLLGGINLAYCIILAAIMPLPVALPGTFLRLATVSAILRTGAIIILLDGLRQREVSTVIPVVYSYPVIVAVIAFFVLGERLGSQQWIAIAVVALGAVLIAFNCEPDRAMARKPRSALILLAAGLFAVADVCGKAALEQMSYWGLFWITALVMGVSFLAISLRLEVLRQLFTLADMKRVVGLVLINETVAPVGMVISFYALEHGPVSLVSTLLSTRPLFVLLFTVVMSRLAPGFVTWSGERRLVALRLMATIMIVAGIAVIEIA